jgi:hypothetical protein
VTGFSCISIILSSIFVGVIPGNLRRINLFIVNPGIGIKVKIIDSLRSGINILVPVLMQLTKPVSEQAIQVAVPMEVLKKTRPFSPSSPIGSVWSVLARPRQGGLAIR